MSTRTRFGSAISPGACQTKSTIKRRFSQAGAQHPNASIRSASAPKRRDGTRRAIQALPVPPPRKRALSQSPTRASERRDATSRRSRAQVTIVAATQTDPRRRPGAGGTCGATSSLHPAAPEACPTLSPTLGARRIFKARTGPPVVWSRIGNQTRARSSIVLSLHYERPICGDTSDLEQVRFVVVTSGPGVVKVSGSPA
jgi:hypothetical protein